MSMNPRYMPGGDKYEAIKADEHRPFYERVKAEEAEIRSAMFAQIHSYIDEQVEQGFEVSWREFVDKYSEWNFESLYEDIVAEMGRYMKEIVENGLFDAS